MSRAARSGTRLRREAPGLISLYVNQRGTIMPAAAWVTLAIATLIIAAAALGLLRVIFHLMAVRQTLGTVIVGVMVVAHQTRTVPEVLPSVNASLKPVRDFCEFGPERRELTMSSSAVAARSAGPTSPRRPRAN